MEPQEAPSRKKKMLWSTVALVCVFVGWFLFQLFGPNPRIIISKETTVITSPLRDDGLPDYQAYWRDLGRDGVTFENNGAVLFWQAIWPGNLDHEDQLQMSDTLGFAEIPSSANALQSPDGKVVRQRLTFWLTEKYQPGLTAEESAVLLSEEFQERIREESVYALINEAMARPWTSEQIPPLAEWVVANEKPFALLEESIERPSWWSPSPSLLDKHYKGAIQTLLPDVQSVRSVGRAFCTRAMWHAGEGRREEAWADLQTALRFVRVGSKRDTIVDQLIAIVIDKMALDRIVQLLQQDEIDVKFSRQVLNHLISLEKPSDMLKCYDQGERMIYADTVIMLAQKKIALQELGYDLSVKAFESLTDLRLNWNYVLREGNHWYDRLVGISKKSKRQDRIAAFKAFEDDLSELASTLDSPGRWVGSLFSIHARSAIMSDSLLNMMLPALGSAMDAEDRGVVALDLTRVAAALAVYRAEQGEYPENLTSLTPDVLNSVPDDLFSGKPFIYERKPDGGYLLYSVFQNGTDDEGTDHGGEIVGGEWIKLKDNDIDFRETDLVIRVPMPKFALPTPPMLEE